jgi:hypothetical protein
MANNKDHQELNPENLDKIAGGHLAKNPAGSADTDDKYLVVDDNTNEVIAKTGGYRHARKIAEKMNLSTDFIENSEVKRH